MVSASGAAKIRPIGLAMQDFQKVFENYDLIIGPTAPTVAYDLDTQGHDLKLSHTTVRLGMENENEILPTLWK